MRWIAPILFLLAAPVQAGLIGEDTDRALCRAAVTDSALPTQLNDLMEAGDFRFDDAGELLSLECDGRTLVQAMLDEQQAENLEYAVIDLGLDLNQPIVRMGGQTLSVAEWLELQADGHENPEVRRFAASYLKRFRDETFNPNLLVSAQ